jgi:cell division protein FtsL
MLSIILYGGDSLRQKINGFIAVIVVVIILFSITMSDEILQTIRNTIDKNDVTEDKQSAKDNGSSNEMEIIEPASAQGMPEGIYLEILPRV